MTPEKLKCIIEAALMIKNSPISMNELQALFEQDISKPEKNDIRFALEALQQDYEQRGIELKEVANGFRFQVRTEYADWINRLFEDKPPRYSRALLETLAIIAYRQPVTRGEIEEVRGVSVNSNIIKTLQEREWVRVVGHRDIPGKPELLATTKQFLDYFNLKKLSELPSLAEIKDYDMINPDLFDSLEQVAQQPAENEQQAPEVEEDILSEDERGAVDSVEPLDEQHESEDPETNEDNNDVVEQQKSEEQKSDDDVVMEDNVVPFSNV